MVQLPSIGRWLSNISLQPRPSHWAPDSYIFLCTFSVSQTHLKFNVSKAKLIISSWIHSLLFLSTTITPVQTTCIAHLDNHVCLPAGLPAPLYTSNSFSTLQLKGSFQKARLITSPDALSETSQWFPSALRRQKLHLGLLWLFSQLHLTPQHPHSYSVSHVLWILSSWMLSSNQCLLSLQAAGPLFSKALKSVLGSPVTLS